SQPPPPPSSEGATSLSRKSKGKGGPYICSLCSKEFKNGYNLRRHQAIHAGGVTKPPRGVTSTNKMPTMVPLSLLSVTNPLGDSSSS
ncbi:MAZ protein, partial [Turnix velox]|nr:MAZ protein [Turnix velox]